MARLGDMAHIVFSELAHEGVDYESPLEDKAVFVYKAVRRYAEVNRWPRREWKGRAGRADHFIMRRLIDDLFPDMDRATGDRVAGQVNQVLRNTGAAVCVQRHRTGDQGEDINPVWFVADRMPDNIVDVAIGVASRGLTRRVNSPFSPTRNEAKLTPEEAGETRPPGDVVTTQTKKQLEAQQNFSIAAQERRRKAEEARARDQELVYENVATLPIPIAAQELVQLVDLETSRVRRMLNDLVAEGRLVARQEELSEREVRTGGRGLPAARRPLLYWPAPGPVPLRTELPPGVKPMKPVSELHAQHARERRDFRDKVVAFLRDTARGEQRRLTRIAEHMGMTIEEVRDPLFQLVRKEVIHRDNNGRYYVGPAGSVPPAVRKTEDTVDRLVEEAQAKEKPAAEVTVPEGMDPRVQQVIGILADIVGEQGPSPREGELEQRVKELEETVAKQRQTIEHLRGAIAGLTG